MITIRLHLGANRFLFMMYDEKNRKEGIRAKQCHDV